MIEEENEKEKKNEEIQYEENDVIIDSPKIGQNPSDYLKRKIFEIERNETYNIEDKIYNSNDLKEKIDKIEKEYKKKIIDISNNENKSFNEISEEIKNIENQGKKEIEDAERLFNKHMNKIIMKKILKKDIKKEIIELFINLKIIKKKVKIN